MVGDMSDQVWLDGNKVSLGLDEMIADLCLLYLRQKKGRGVNLCLLYVLSDLVVLIQKMQ